MPAFDGIATWWRSVLPPTTSTSAADSPGVDQRRLDRSLLGEPIGVHWYHPWLTALPTAPWHRMLATRASDSRSSTTTRLAPPGAVGAAANAHRIGGQPHRCGKTDRRRPHHPPANANHSRSLAATSLMDLLATNKRYPLTPPGPAAPAITTTSRPRRLTCPVSRPWPPVSLLP